MKVNPILTHLLIFVHEVTQNPADTKLHLLLWEESSHEFNPQRNGLGIRMLAGQPHAAIVHRGNDASVENQFHRFLAVTNELGHHFQATLRAKYHGNKMARIDPSKVVTRRHIGSATNEEFLVAVVTPTELQEMQLSPFHCQPTYLTQDQFEDRLKVESTRNQKALKKTNIKMKAQKLSPAIAAFSFSDITQFDATLIRLGFVYADGLLPKPKIQKPQHNTSVRSQVRARARMAVAS